jgi:hypothetical protein
MKSPFGYRKIFIVLFVLVLAQFACKVGGQRSTAAPQEAPTSKPEATQTPPAGTSDRGTPDEAMAMLQKAVAHYNAVGREQALKDFTGRVTPFFDRDLYMACVDSHLIITANGGFPNLVGSASEPLSRAAWDSASSSQIGSVDYQYTDPVTQKTEPKTFFYEKVDSDVCGVGVYHP